MTSQPSVDIHKPLPISRPLPDLYKFKSLEGDGLKHFEAMVVFSEFYFAHPHEFNDPFECRPRFTVSLETDDPALLQAKHRTYVDNMVTELRRDPAERERLLQRPIVEGVEALTDAYRPHGIEHRMLQVFCMSTTKRDPLIWAHYANGHRGACVHLNQLYVPFASALKVSYETDYPTIPILDKLPPDEVHRLALCVKGWEWRHEVEYRVIRYLRSPKANMDMEWKGQIGRASPNAVTGVTLGARISRKNEADVLAMVRHRSVEIPVWKAEPEEGRFGFIFKLVSE